MRITNEGGSIFGNPGAVWRGHIGIEGNAEVDTKEELASLEGELAGHTRIATKAGLRATHKATRRSWRRHTGSLSVHLDEMQQRPTEQVAV